MRRTQGSVQIGIVISILVILAGVLVFILINRSAIPSWLPIAGFTLIGVLGVSFFLALRILAARGKRSQRRADRRN